MLNNINIRINNQNIDIDIEYLDIEVGLDAGGGIENIWIDGRLPTSDEALVINDNLRKIQEEVFWRLYEDRKFKDYPAYMEM